MNDIVFSPQGWSDYLYWQSQDRKTLKKINALLLSIQREGPENGLGKPEALRKAPGWSRRIDEKNRMLYRVTDGNVRITSLRGHYQDT